MQYKAKIILTMEKKDNAHEDDINKWLSENPDIEIIEVRLVETVVNCPKTLIIYRGVK